MKEKIFLKTLFFHQFYENEKKIQNSLHPPPSPITLCLDTAASTKKIRNAFLILAENFSIER